jgi:hypothetical protein
MHGAGEEPRPQCGNGRRIQAEQMPPFRKIVEATGQDSVYFAAAPHLLDTPILDASLGRTVEVRGIPRLAQSTRSDPDFLYATRPVFAGAVFCKESRMKFVERTKPNRKSGVMGHPGSVGMGKSSGEFSLDERGAPFRYSSPHRWGGAQPVQISRPRTGQPQDHEGRGAGAEPFYAASASLRTAWEHPQGLLQLLSPAPTLVPEYCRRCPALRRRG